MPTALIPIRANHSSAQPQMAVQPEAAPRNSSHEVQPKPSTQPGDASNCNTLPCALPACGAVSITPRATVRVWYTDAPWPDWVPPGADSEVLSMGTEKAWARVCKGSCSGNKCQVDGEQADKCFAQKDKPQ
jgi:hypothetical protein